jgi:putative spermidine/putrescine transport system ATP-binding protein
MGYRNLFPSSAEAVDGGVAVLIGGARLIGTPIGTVGTQATVAIRPDDMRLTSGGPIAATVEIAEYHGRDFYAVARLADGAELYFRAEQRVAAGEAVRLDAAPARVLVYAA